MIMCQRILANSFPFQRFCRQRNYASLAYGPIEYTNLDHNLDTEMANLSEILDLLFFMNIYRMKS